MEVKIFPTNAPELLKEGVNIISKSWGSNDFATFLKDLLVAITHNGGLALIAYHGNEMVGFSFAIRAFRKGKYYLYSHQTGVIPEYRNSEIGYQLKLKQREWAIQNNIDLISWTFDPLQGLNSRFNLHKLGVIVRVYHRNHYGIMTDALNKGMPSDRFVAEWYINTDHVKKRLNKVFEKYKAEKSAIKTKEKNGYRIVEDIDLSIDDENFLIEIPYDINLIKKKDMEEALRWRKLTAEVYIKYFKSGYLLIDSITTDNRNFQIATKTIPAGIEKESIFSDLLNEG